MSGAKRTARKRKKVLMRLWMQWYKAHMGCQRCGDHEGNLTFHHRNPRHKRAKVKDLIARNATWHIVMVEIGKCDVLCWDCHRAVHEQKDRATERPEVRPTA